MHVNPLLPPITLTETTIDSPCEEGVPLVDCFVSPCQFSLCPAYPEAVCEDDYCGGCNARWYVQQGDQKREVTDDSQSECPSP